MSSSVLHHCPFCGYEAEVSNTLAVFAETPHCRQCGLSASESDKKMQDDLAALFARQMSVAAVPQPENLPRATPPTPDMLPQRVDTAYPVTYSVSQHYHHSSLLALPGSNSGIVQDLQREQGLSAEELLVRHNINPSFLFPSQITLFQQAALDQKARLIELWQISPPNGGTAVSEPAIVKAASEPPRSPKPDLNINAQDGVRDHSVQPDDSDMMMDEDMSGIDVHHAEPYVTSGYESLAQREYDISAKKAAAEEAAYKPATDPVYKGHDWCGSSSLVEPMEHQYGAFEQKNMYIGCGVRRAHWADDHDML